MPKAQNRVLPLFAGALIQLCIGIIYIWSVFKTDVIAHYSSSVPPDTAVLCANLTYSIMLATFVLGIVVGGRLNDLKGPRPVVFTGGLMFVAGILLSALSTSVFPGQPWLLCLFYGGIAGFGVGAAYTSTISCAQKWFYNRRGFATGVIVCAFGASTVIFTPLANSLLASQGVTNTLLIFGVIFAIVIVAFGWFVKNPPEGYMAASPAAQQISDKKQFSPSETVKTKQLYMLIACMMLLTPAYFILNPLFKTLGESRGLIESQVLLSIMLTGVASAAGRLIAPWLSDKIGRKNVLVLLYIITIAAVLLLIGGSGYLYMALIALVAFAFGGSAGVFPAISADYFGSKNAGANYGLVMIGFAAAALLFPAVANSINLGGEPTALTFVIPAVACVVGIVLTFLLKPPGSKSKSAAN